MCSPEGMAASSSGPSASAAPLLLHNAHDGQPPIKNTFINFDLFSASPTRRTRSAPGRQARAHSEPRRQVSGAETDAEPESPKEVPQPKASTAAQRAERRAKRAAGTGGRKDPSKFSTEPGNQPSEAHLLLNAANIKAYAERNKPPQPTPPPQPPPPQPGRMQPRFSGIGDQPPEPLSSGCNVQPRNVMSPGASGFETWEGRRSQGSVGSRPSQGSVGSGASSQDQTLQERLHSQAAYFLDAQGPTGAPQPRGDYPEPVSPTIDFRSMNSSSTSPGNRRQLPESIPQPPMEWQRSSRGYRNGNTNASPADMQGPQQSYDRPQRVPNPTFMPQASFNQAPPVPAFTRRNMPGDFNQGSQAQGAAGVFNQAQNFNQASQPQGRNAGQLNSHGQLQGRNFRPREDQGVQSVTTNSDHLLYPPPGIKHPQYNDFSNALGAISFSRSHRDPRSLRNPIEIDTWLKEIDDWRNDSEDELDSNDGGAPDRDPSLPMSTASWSAGAARHGEGRCKPCAWNWKPSGCGKAQNCEFCHLCEEGVLKMRKKAQHAALKERIRTAKKKGRSSAKKEAYEEVAVARVPGPLLVPGTVSTTLADEVSSSDSSNLFQWL